MPIYPLPFLSRPFFQRFLCIDTCLRCLPVGKAYAMTNPIHIAAALPRIRPINPEYSIPYTKERANLNVFFQSFKRKKFIFQLKRIGNLIGVVTPLFK